MEKININRIEDTNQIVYCIWYKRRNLLQKKTRIEEKLMKTPNQLVFSNLCLFFLFFEEAKLTHRNWHQGESNLRP